MNRYSVNKNRGVKRSRGTTLTEYFPDFKILQTDVSAQEEYVRRVSEPRTPEDLILAMQNPYTKVYKDMMNMLMMNMFIEDILHALIIKYVDEKYIASKAEKEIILREITRYEIEMQKVFSAVPIIQHEKIFSDVKRHDVEKLNVILAKCVTKYNQLQKRHEEIEKRIEALEIKQEENLQRWEEQKQENISDFRRELQEEADPDDRFIYIRDDSVTEGPRPGFRAVDPEGEEGEAILQEVFEEPSPVTLTRVLSDAFDAADATEIKPDKIENHEEPTEKLAEDTDAKKPPMVKKPSYLDVLANNLAVDKSLKLCHKGTGIVEPEHGKVEEALAGPILAALKANKTGVKHVGKPRGIIPFKVQNEIYRELKQKQAEMNVCETMKSQEEALGKSCIRQLELLTKTPIKNNPFQPSVQVETKPSLSLGQKEEK